VTSTPPKARYFILASLALGFIDGVTANWLFPGQLLPPSSLAITIAALFLIFRWYQLDSDSREFKRTPLLSMAIIGVTILAVPYYLFRTRGFRQGLLATLVVLLAAIGYSAVGYVGQIAARAMRA
jgi:hypothetical protein